MTEVAQNLSAMSLQSPEVKFLSIYIPPNGLQNFTLERIEKILKLRRIFSP